MILAGVKLKHYKILSSAAYIYSYVVFLFLPIGGTENMYTNGPMRSRLSR